MITVHKTVRTTINIEELTKDSHIATWAAPAINAPPITPQMHPNAIALRLPSQSLVTPTEALPSHPDSRVSHLKPQTKTAS